MATYTAFTQAVDNLYQEIYENAFKDTSNPNPNSKKKDRETPAKKTKTGFFTAANIPVEDQIKLWRTKLHDVYEDSDKKLKLLIETNVCKSNKKAKKRYNKIKNSEEFYKKHVWQGSGASNAEMVFLTQLESILKAVNE